jgi:hypothetical protein
MRMRALVGFLAATAIAGCGADGADRDAVGGGGPSRIGEEATVSVGETVDFSMYTHCGVESTNFNGRVWNAVQPLYSSPDKLGPPSDWDDPYQDGRLTLESRDRAVFAAVGERVVLTPSETGEPLRPCD